MFSPSFFGFSVEPNNPHKFGDGVGQYFRHLNRIAGASVSERDGRPQTDHECVLQILISAGINNELQIRLHAEPLSDLGLISDFENHFGANAY
jgi:hypothetical protein